MFVVQDFMSRKLPFFRRVSGVIFELCLKDFSITFLNCRDLFDFLFYMKNKEVYFPDSIFPPESLNL